MAGEGCQFVLLCGADVRGHIFHDLAKQRLQSLVDHVVQRVTAVGKSDQKRFQPLVTARQQIDQQIADAFVAVVVVAQQCRDVVRQGVVVRHPGEHLCNRLAIGSSWPFF